MRGSRRRGAALAAASLLALAACGDDDRHIPEPVTEIDVTDARGRESRAASLDPTVVAPLATPKVQGRIIYDPPASLARVEAADTLVRRSNTALTTPEPAARGGRGTSTGATPRDSGGPPRPR